MDGVELVWLFEERSVGKLVAEVLHPLPLDDGGLDERGGGVGVVFEELGRLTTGGAGPADIEAAVDGGRLLVPSPLDERDGFGRDVELRVALVVDDMLRGGEAHRLQLVAGGFEDVDFNGGEPVGGGLVPVGLRGHRGWRMECQAVGFDDALPVGARSERDAVHLLSGSSVPGCVACVAAAVRAAETTAGGVAHAWDSGVAAT